MDKFLAIGNPYGIGISVASGIISATGRDYGNPYLRLIQTDAAINPGNSGGALVNESGNLIGINTKIYSKTGAYQGLGFAIPSNIVVQIASELIKDGKIRKMWMGNIRVKSVRINLNTSLVNGLQIIEIDEVGRLYEKGIKHGFNKIIESKKNGSVSISMQGDEFDRTAPMMSLYIEMIK